MAVSARWWRTSHRGFTYESSSLEPVAVRVDGQSVQFTLLGEAQFSYTVMAADEEGSYEFSGIFKDADKVEEIVGGQFEVLVSETPPPTPTPTPTPTETPTPVLTHSDPYPCTETPTPTARRLRLPRSLSRRKRASSDTHSDPHTHREANSCADVDSPAHANSEPGDFAYPGAYPDPRGVAHSDACRHGRLRRVLNGFFYATDRGDSNDDAVASSDDWGNFRRSDFNTCSDANCGPRPCYYSAGDSVRRRSAGVGDSRDRCVRRVRCGCHLDVRSNEQAASCVKSLPDGRRLDGLEWVA